MISRKKIKEMLDDNCFIVFLLTFFITIIIGCWLGDCVPSWANIKDFILIFIYNYY